MSFLTNLTAYFKFEGNSIDAVGSYSGTDSNVTYNTSNGKIGQGAGFTGSLNSFISVPNIPYSIIARLVFLIRFSTSGGSRGGGLVLGI